MTNEESAFILGVNENAGEAEIRQKYSELFNDYQLRLTNAPTPNLKKLYQKNLQELNEALETMLGNKPGVPQDDLPSVTPTFKIEETNKRVAESAPPTQPNFQKVVGKVSKKLSAKEVEQAEKHEKLFKVFMIISITFITISALLAILYFDQIKRGKELKNTLAVTEQTAREVVDLKQKLLALENGKFKIKNLGNSPLQITWIIVSFRNQEGEMVKYEGMLNTLISPGSTQELNMVSGSRVLWDGSVITYACGLQYGGRQFIQSGLWSSDSKEGLLFINLN